MIDVDTPAAPARPRITSAHLKSGAVLLIAAAAAGAPAQALHPLPDPHHPDSFAPIVAASDEWVAIHLTAMLAYVLTAGGLVLLLLSFAGTRADVLYRLGTAASVLGVSVATVWMACDGIATKRLVDLWAASAGDDADRLFAVARGLEEIGLGLFFLTLIVIFGVPIMLASLAMLQTRLFPAWLGWFGLGTSCATIVIGVAQAFTGRTMLWTHLLTPAAVIGVSVWSVVTALLMWRMASRPLNTEVLPSA